MITYTDALARIAALSCPEPPRETVELSAAAGRVLAQSIVLDRDVPGFDRATMDGYAVVPEGDRRVFAIKGTVAAGTRFAGRLLPGEGVRIMTGAPAPERCCVVPIERTDRGSERVVVAAEADLRVGMHIARRGEDGHAGEAVLRTGVRLAPATIALAAMAGCGELSVRALPRLGLISTGDELAESGAAAQGGVFSATQIHDSNGPLLAALAAGLGLPTTRRRVRDDPDALSSALRELSAQCPIIVTTGGVSAGDRDFIPSVAGALGYQVVFHHVAMQPGKPVFLAQLRSAQQVGSRVILGLPGNPVSVLATAHLFLLPLLERFGAPPATAWQEQTLVALAENPGKRQLFLPAAHDSSGLRPIRWNGSGDLIAAATADGLIDLAPGQRCDAGQRIRFLPYAGHVAGQRGTMPRRAHAP